MKLSKMITEINTLIDDQLPDDWITGWINDGLAEIGSTVHAVFPEMDAALPDAEFPLPQKWQRLLIKVFAAGRAKEQDSSQFEYTDLYRQFDQSLNDFQAEYVVPVQYKELYPVQELSMPDGTTYLTNSGDTLAQVATTYNTNAQAIQDANADIEIRYVTDYETFNTLDQPALPWFNAF